MRASRKLLAERISHLREVCDLRERSVEKALELQAKETERRLDNLNHEAERIAKSQAEHVSRQLFDQVVGELHKADDDAATFRAETNGRIRGLSWAFGIVSALLGLGMAFYRHG